jgi:hypothetical protein
VLQGPFGLSERVPRSVGTEPRAGGPLRKFALLVGIIVALGLGAMPSAFAANPDVNHFSDTFSETVDDFCGTGQPVEVSTFLRITVFLAPNQPVDFRNVAQVKVVYTNPQNDATVLRHAAGPSSDTAISGDPEGAHEVTLFGLATQLRAAGGGVLLQNAGYLTLHQVFNDAGELVSTEIVVNRGPHPNAESGFLPDGTPVLLCEVLTRELGLN